MNIRKVIALLVALVCLTGCSASAGNVVVELSQSSYDAFEALDQGDCEKAVGLFQTELEKKSDFVSMIGLVKAQMGLEDYEGARDTLLEIRERYPEENLPASYQGQVYAKLEDYENAAIAYHEWARSLLKKNNDTFTENKNNEVTNNYSDLRLAKERFSENLWKLNDAQKIHDLAQELYLLDTEDADLLSDYVQSCANLGDDVCGDELIEAVKGTKAEFIVTALVESYRLVKSGDLEDAKKRLFDPDHVEDRLSGTKLSYGDMADGKQEGVRVSSQQVFNRWGAVIGSASNDVWSGECEAWNITTGTASRTIQTENGDKSIAGSYYDECCYTGVWKEGKPDGAVLESEHKKYHYPEAPDRDREYCWEMELLFADGLAEGEAIRYDLWEDNGVWSRDERPVLLIHQFQEGYAVPFLAHTYDGDLMVYEWETDYQRKETYDYESDDCGHSYIWIMGEEDNV